jgi:hypothetical protein
MTLLDKMRAHQRAEEERRAALGWRPGLKAPVQFSLRRIEAFGGSARELRELADQGLVKKKARGLWELTREGRKP